MAAGLKRHIECGASCLRSGSLQGEYFCVRRSGSEMKTPADDPALFDDDGTDHRIRARRSLALRRQAKGQGPIVEISGTVGHRFLRLPTDAFGAGLPRFDDDVDTLVDFTTLARAPVVFLDVAGLADAWVIAACAAANRAIATRNGEQLT